MLVIKYRKIFFTISGIVVALSIAVVAIFGLKFGIDFTGGTLTEFTYEGQRVAKSELVQKLDPLNIGDYSLREAGESAYILRTGILNNNQKNLVVEVLSSTNAHIERFNEIGPTIGKELRTKAWLAILLVALAIVLFIAFVFRGVSEPVKSWKYGVIAIIALMHDIIVPVGIFAILGYFAGAEVGVLFVMALLAILGYSVNDTIVVFDRVRENLRENAENNKKEDFEETVGRSLNQTYVRSINTSLTTLAVLAALFFLGAPVTAHFALVLIAGVLAGTYSSIFLATPLLVAVKDWQDR